MSEPRSKPLRPLLVAQFLGAFNDNAWKLVLVMIGIRVATAGLEGEADSTAAAQARTTLAFVVFLLPMVAVALPAGALADRVSKRSVIVAMKALELILMTAGAGALMFDPSAGTAALVVLGLMGLQSGLFSPAKYGILPEIVPHDRLSAANGAIEMWTVLAIIGGTAVGPLILDAAGDQPWIAAAVLAGLAALGFVASLRIPNVPPASTSGGSLASIGHAWKALREDRSLWLASLGAALFWAIGSLLGQNIIVYGTMVLGRSDTEAGFPLATLGLGIAIGSVLAGKLSAGKVELGLIPLGATLLGVFTLLHAVLPDSFALTLVMMALVGISSGLLIVPLNSLIQWRAPSSCRGGVIAVSNVLAGIGMLIGSFSVGILAGFDISPRGILMAAAIVCLLGTVWSLWLLPSALLRLVFVLLTHTLYRLRVIGRENVPEEGGVLLTPNHVSFVDGLFLMASIDRPVRFLIDASYFNHPLVRPFVTAMHCIPISSDGGPRQMMRALKDAGEYLDQGHVVCIFPEGQLTRTGGMQPFKRGMGRIAKGRDAVIVPVHLDHVWGSIFSRSGGRFLFKRPERIPYPVTVSFGEPLTTDTPVSAVRNAVQALSSDAWLRRKQDRVPLHRSAIHALRRSRFRLAFADGSTPKVTRIGALTRTVALGRALRKHWEGQQNVGILLPPSVVGAVVNLAATMAGRTSVNLNYTAGPAGMGSAARQSGLKTVVTSRTFLEKAKLEPPPGVELIHLEDLAPSIGSGDKLVAALLAWFAPARWLEKACGCERTPSMDDIATIIFSSGSTGEPKGVLLSHFNVDSNVEGTSQVFQIVPEDRLLGILPLFHSFGYLLLWFSTNRGAALVFHPNPVDAPVIGHLVQTYALTILLATPTFLQIYLRRCTPEQFGSLRLVVAGAEKLSDKLRDAFSDTFGLRPLEGYGTTECAPVIAVSAPDFRAQGFFQPGSKRGWVGQPVPGVTLRVVDPDTREPLGFGEAGMLLVKGPNVMQGYLDRDELTAKVLDDDGWYTTGDIAVLDEDGFVKITDRLSRFSKIGGEMVPHGKVEAALHEAAETNGEQVFGVTAIPDAKKGERLAVLHTLEEDRIPEVLEKLKGTGLPNLFIPRKDSFVHVETLPVLGTGKIDLKALKRIAVEALGG